MIFLPRNLRRVFVGYHAVSVHILSPGREPEVEMTLVDRLSQGVWARVCISPGGLLKNCPGTWRKLDVESSLTIQGWRSKRPPRNHHLQGTRAAVWLVSVCVMLHLASVTGNSGKCRHDQIELSHHGLLLLILLKNDC